MQVVSEFVVTSPEASSGFSVLEAAHRFVSALDPAMILLDPIVQILVGPVFHSAFQFGADRAWITVMTIRRDPRGNGTSHRFGRSKERLRRRHVTSLAQPQVNKGTEAIDRAVEVAPAALNLDVRLVNVPTLSNPGVVQNLPIL